MKHFNYGESCFIYLNNQMNLNEFHWFEIHFDNNNCSVFTIQMRFRSIHFQERNSLTLDEISLSLIASKSGVNLYRKTRNLKM